MMSIIMADARTRMIQSAALLFREKGVEATALSDVIEHSGAPRGSIYHHFPGGKAELAENATRLAGDYVAHLIEGAQDDPVLLVRRFVESWRSVLSDSHCSAGCPVVAVAVDGGQGSGVREAAAEVFESWQQLCADALAGRGVAPDRAASLAALMVASVEGAIVLCRAQRDIRPLELVGEELERLVSEALG
jgi:AcrR family transcriptional regulator